MCNYGRTRFLHATNHYSPSWKIFISVSCPNFSYMVTYVRDGYTTRPVLKPSDGFKAGPTALNPAGWLDIRPDRFEAGPTASNSLQYQPTALKPSGRLCNFLKTVLTASQISCISASSSSELQLARSHAGDRGWARPY